MRPSASRLIQPLPPVKRMTAALGFSGAMTTNRCVTPGRVGISTSSAFAANAGNAANSKTTEHHAGAAFTSSPFDSLLSCHGPHPLPSPFHGRGSWSESLVLSNAVEDSVEHVEVVELDDE